LVHQLRYAKITDFQLVLAIDKNVLAFQVPVQYFIIVDVFEAKAQLNKPLKHFIFSKCMVACLSIIQMLLEIAMLSKFHNYAYVGFLVLEAFEVAYDKLVVEVAHDLYLLQYILLVLLSRFYFLNIIVSTFMM